MLPFVSSLSRAEIVAVVAYVASLNGITNPDLTFHAPLGEPPEFGPEGPALPAKAVPGHELFFDAVRSFGRCATCHEVNAMGIPVATAIGKVPADVRALRALASPGVKTASVEGEAMPALVVSQGKQRTVFYDLTSAPPVLRSRDSATVTISQGAAWKHASVLGSYNDAELASILEYLRVVVKP